MAKLYIVVGRHIENNNMVEFGHYLTEVEAESEMSVLMENMIEMPLQFNILEVGSGD
jgi:hypothetical protein